MRNIYTKIHCITLLLILLGSISYAQSLSIYDLEQIQSKDLDLVRSFMIKNGWEFISSDLNVGYDYFEYDLKYDKIGWAAYREDYEKRQWLYLLQKEGYESIVIYQTDFDTFLALEEKVRSSVPHLGTEAQKDMLVSSYRRKGGLEYKFMELAKEEYYYEDRIKHTLIISNFNSLIKRRGDLEMEQKRLEEKKRKQEEERKKNDVLFRHYINDAENAFALKDLGKAKKLYNMALQLRPNDKKSRSRLDQIEEITSFLFERQNTIYAYEEHESEALEQFKRKIEIGLLNLCRDYSNSSCSLSIHYQTDTLGIVAPKLVANESNNAQFKNYQIHFIENNLPPALKINDYFVNADFDFIINTKVDKQIHYKVSKKPSGISMSNAKYYYNVKTYLKEFPYGKYEMTLIDSKVNQMSHTDIGIIRYKSFGGPEKAIYSFLVPGLGKWLITGKERGLYTTITVYSSIGLGIGSKLLSDYYYNKYHTAIDQLEIDKYYNRANNLHQATFGLLGIGIAIWGQDIYWVAKTGRNNKKTEQNYRVALTNGDYYNSLALQIKF